MVLSASSPTSLTTTGSSYTYVSKQVIAAILGVFAMLVISKYDYKKLAKWYKIIYIFSVGILLLVLVPGLGRTVNGARRWIVVPIFSSIQPSEITKLGLIIFFAQYLTNLKDDIKTFKKGFIMPLIIVGIPILILLGVQSHFSASVIIGLVIFIMMIIAGIRMIYCVIAGGIGIGGLTIMYILAKIYGFGAYRLTRITSFLNPWADAQDSGWQIIQSLYAIGSGGLFGVGLRK